MGRSVSYANDSIQIEYATFECEDTEWAGESFDDCVSCMQEVAVKRFPSMTTCDKWLGREDRAVLANQHAYIGISEYCGLVSIWVTPRGDCYGNDPTGLATRWCEQIDLSTLADCFGRRLNKVGAFSNGESVYQVAA